MLKILNGPTESKLFEALRNRRHCHHVYFKVQDDASTEPFQLDVYIDGVECEVDLDNVWRVILQPTRRGGRLVGRYRLPIRSGELTQLVEETNPPISKFGLDPDVEERLRAHGVQTRLDLLTTEFEVCRMLCDDTHGMGMTNEIVQGAIRRFDRLRRRMDELGYNFAGSRRSLNDLFMSF